jgi:flagellar biosynthesis/type III secretory pathway protein FliH
MELIVQTQVEAMTIHYDIETDGLYLQGIEKGIQEGIQEGIEKGIEKGIEEGAALKERQVILTQWSLQEFSLERIALMSGAALERVTQVILAQLQAEGLSEVEAEQSLEAYQAKFI